MIAEQDCGLISQPSLSPYRRVKVETNMAWPQATDYGEAIQNLALNFRDTEISAGQVGTNSLGLPLARTGNFAAVFEVHDTAGPDAWAVKCFTRHVPGRQERYHLIDTHLREHPLPFMVGFRYVPSGVLVGGDWYPFLKMDWVEGLRLDEFLEDCLTKDNYKTKLRVLCRMWVRLAQMLRDAKVGHGDLQHGNVILVPAPERRAYDLRLIDYDGMFVSALSGKPPGEIGHPAFQHPLRSLRVGYGPEVDRFSHLVLYCTLRCLISGGRELWDRHYDGDRLLIGHQDLVDPETATVFRELWQLPDPAAKAMVGHLMLAAKSPLEDVPLLSQLVVKSDVVPLTRLQQQQVEKWIASAGPTTQVGVPGTAVKPVTPPDKPLHPVEHRSSVRRSPEELMEERLLEWVRSDTSPADYYQLLGHPRFHRDREHLLAAARGSNRYLHRYQNHQDDTLANRAIELQMQVAEATSTFTDDQRWRAYDDQLIVKFRELYGARNGRNATVWRRDSLRRWLATRNVTPYHIDEVVEWMLAPVESESQSPPAADASPESKRSSFRSSAFQGPRTQATPPDEIVESVNKPTKPADSGPLAIPPQPKTPRAEPAQPKPPKTTSKTPPPSARPLAKPRTKPSSSPQRRPIPTGAGKVNTPAPAMPSTMRTAPAARPTGRTRTVQPASRPRSGAGPRRGNSPAQTPGRKSNIGLGCLWILGSALISAIVCAAIVLYFIVPKYTRDASDQPEPAPAVVPASDDAASSSTP